MKSCPSEQEKEIMKHYYIFTDILAGFTVNNRVLRLPAIVLLNTTATKKYKWICLESLDVYPKKARVSGSKRRVQ